MDHDKFQSIFCDIIPIIEKAAPVIGSLLGSPATGTILALLASVTGANACNHEEISNLLRNDPDVYSKIAKLESTHADWLKQISL